MVVLIERSDEWEEGQVNLHRIYGFCREASAVDCEAVKAEFSAKIAVKPTKLSAASLRIIVRDSEYLAYVKGLKSEGKAELGLYEPIGEDLYILLAADSPETIALVSDKGLGELGITAEQAWATAKRQTRANLPAIPTAQQLSGAAVAYQDQEYLGSLLADREAWARLAAEVGPDLFVTVVSDHFVFVGMMPDGPNLDAFKKTVAEDCTAQERCISPNIYRFRNGQWTIAR